MSSSRSKTGIILGALLICTGILLLLGEITGIASFDLLWPVLIIALGLGFFVGMRLSGADSGYLALPGSIIVTIGVILFIQNAFDLWETWSYAWALLVVAVGIGLTFWGIHARRVDIRARGRKITHLGMVLFVIFGIIFSVLWDALGVASGGYGFFGFLLMSIGFYLLIYRSVHLMRGTADWIERDLFWPVIMVGAGVVFFLFGLGQFPLIALRGLLGWWPLALILVGLDWLVGRRWPVVGAVLACLIVVFTLLLMFDPLLLDFLQPYIPGG